jgi:beta-alanine degradation protein BauB
MRTLIIAAAFAFAVVAEGRAQDAAAVAPDVYKTVLDNNRVRVLEVRMKAGAKVGLHRHPDHMLYMVTAGSLVFEPEGRKPYEMTLNAGEALWLPGQTRATENDTDKEVRAVLVEFKQAVAPAAKGRGGKRGRVTRRR